MRRFLVFVCLGLGALGSMLLFPARATAQVCPPGNLLAGKRPIAWQDIRNNLSLPTDDQVGQEGTVWDAPLAVILDSAVATLTYDLGAVTTLNALVAQADANDKYTIWGSTDGQTYRVLGRIDEVEGVHGLRTRTLGLGGVSARFVRFGEGVGDNFYSLSELQVFCQVPTPFPPVIKIGKAPIAVVPKTIYTYWNDESARGWEVVLAMLGYSLLSWGLTLAKEGRPQFRAKLRRFLLASCGVLAALTYVNFGFFHFGNFIHSWDTFHYYVGSKYFRELSYDRLYECVAVADAENPQLRRRVELRKITNLRTNALETTTEILAHPERCKSHFSPERWQSFTRDIAYFRGTENPKRWDDTSTDHGYNGTPIWNVAGTLLANTGPASKTQIFLLNLFDPAFYIGMILIVWWAFGWRALSVGLLVFATNFGNRFYWTGGAFLRWDWLFYLVASVCLLKKNRPLLGGFALGYSTLLRIFPGFMFVGPLLAVGTAAGRAVYKNARLGRAQGTADEAPRADVRPVSVVLRSALTSPSLFPYYRFFVGGALAVALFIPVSFAFSGGPQAYKSFYQNTLKHKGTPLTNYMGLKTVIAYRYGQAGRDLKNEQLTDPWRPWKEARLKAYQEAKPLFYIAVLGFLVLMGSAVYRGAEGGLEPWMTAAFGATFIAVGIELTCYYYAFILVIALLYEKKPEVGTLLLLLTAFSEFVSLAPISGMPTWLDEQYTLISFATLVAFGMILWWFTPWAAKVSKAETTPDQDEEDEEHQGEKSRPRAKGKTGRAGKHPGRQRGRGKRAPAAS